MKFALLPAIVLCITFTPSACFAWGVWGHTHINKGAVMALPKDMCMFFYNHADFITTESAAPDVRKHIFSDRSESSRHFIDLEWYGYTGSGKMPETLNNAISKYKKDSVEQYGILPWCIQDLTEKLTEAFRNRRKTEILFIAANLGHYVADANMPLHTSANHNGQLTGQIGIHAFWESQLPELFGKNYNFCAGEARFISNVGTAVWAAIDSSHALAEVLLRTEAKMKKDNPEDKQYAFGKDGKPQKNTYGQLVHTYEYAHVYHELLNGMVERQMRRSIMLTADLWYTAWVNAGKPDLSTLDPDYVTERNKVFYRQDVKAWQRGKVKGCGSDREF